MSDFKDGELVLISGFNGGYMVAEIVRKDGEGYQVSHGMYSTYWSAKDIHKCPASIKRLVKKGKSNE